MQIRRYVTPRRFQTELCWRLPAILCLEREELAVGVPWLEGEKDWVRIPAEEMVNGGVSFHVKSRYISEIRVQIWKKGSHERVYPALFGTRRVESGR